MARDGISFGGWPTALQRQRNGYETGFDHGGGSGIGRGIAQAMADAGDAVTVAGRRMDALQETDGGRGMTCLTCDVTDEASVNALFSKPYDVVIANAGAGKSMKLRDMPLDVFKGTVDVNLTGTFLTFRAALQTMTRGGRLIAIASTAGLQGAEHLGLRVGETWRGRVGACAGDRGCA